MRLVYLLKIVDIENRLKSHEQPNEKPKRNKKGKLAAARLRQLKKSRNKLREKLKDDL
jgi:hypothetical protein